MKESRQYNEGWINVSDKERGRQPSAMNEDFDRTVVEKFVRTDGLQGHQFQTISKYQKLFHDNVTGHLSYH